MRYFFFCMTFLGFLLPSIAMAQTKTEELLQKAGSGKEGAYWVMGEFAACAGFYEGMGEIMMGVDNAKNRKRLEGVKEVAGSARHAAAYFWKPYSKSPMVEVKKITAEAKGNFLRVADEGFERLREVVGVMKSGCSAIMPLQVDTWKKLGKPL
mgnify:CR=1 FL=1